MFGRTYLLAAVLVAAWGVRAQVAPHAAPAHGSLAQFPVTTGSWVGRDTPVDPAIIAQTGSSEHLNRVYRSNVRDTSVGLYVAYYANQKAGEAVHSPMNCLPGNGWQPLQTDRIAIDAAGTGGTSTINKVVVEHGVNQALVLYWYQTPGRVVASEYLSKAFLVKDAFSTGRTDVALVRIFVPINIHVPDGAARALDVALPFANDVLSKVHNGLFQS